MKAYGWKARIENDFYEKDFAALAKKHGTEDFGSLENSRGEIELDCGEALYLYGGRDALLKGLKAAGKNFLIESSCSAIARLGVFIETVGAGVKTKQIMMIAPANRSLVSRIGERHFYKWGEQSTIEQSLQKGIGSKQLEMILDYLMDPDSYVMGRGKDD